MKPDSLIPDRGRQALLTDLYELTMAAGYWCAGMADRTATFDLFFRELPEPRNYMVAAGLEQVVQFLLEFRFTEADISYLRQLPVFAGMPPEWFDALGTLQFTGDLWGVPEGTPVFGGEPLLRVTAPLIEAQIVETYLLSSVAYSTSVASKAARIRGAARGRAVYDFGSRRAHGPQAGLLAARASFLAGFSGTSNVSAAERLGIPPVGTMAHSWIMAFDDERDAFQQFIQMFPQHAVLLIDTYDTLEGARRALECRPHPLAVRLDSGDIASLARQVRGLLDTGGGSDIQIFASGDLNEHKIDRLVRDNTPIDSFGIGTELATVIDAPALGCVYKLVELKGSGRHAGRVKLSPGKRTYPGRKQLFRITGPDGRLHRDLIALADEQQLGIPLLQPVLAQGKLVDHLPSVLEIQAHFMRQLVTLPPELLALDHKVSFPVQVSDQLQEEYNRLAREHERENK